MLEDYQHISVLTSQLIDGLQIKQGGHYLDCTCGGGGHSLAILLTTAAVQITLIDQDQQAIVASQHRLAEFAASVEFWQGNFCEYIPRALFDGIIADLGVSSPQIDRAERGFSFRHRGSLDMRMNQSQSLTAEEIINHWDETTIANLIYEYGEERLSRRIARAIVKERPLTSTTALADLIWRNVPHNYRHGGIHPATRTFQALRIAVNRELDCLASWLQKSPDWLRDGGRMAVISFHSLEDRLVKNAFRADERLEVITKKPIVAGDHEIQQNPRARSAKLRVAQKKPIANACTP